MLLKAAVLQKGKDGLLGAQLRTNISIIAKLPLKKAEMLYFHFGPSQFLG